MPPALARRIYDEFAKALANPAVTQKLADQGMDIVGGPPQELDRFVRGEIARWGAVVKENKIRAGD
jgi:tripartite-type tricarboxylate transporter receptor subunit TctC